MQDYLVGSGYCHKYSQCHVPYLVPIWTVMTEVNVDITMHKFVLNANKLLSALPNLPLSWLSRQMGHCSSQGQGPGPGPHYAGVLFGIDS